VSTRSAEDRASREPATLGAVAPSRDRAGGGSIARGAFGAAGERGLESTRAGAPAAGDARADDEDDDEGAAVGVLLLLAPRGRVCIDDSSVSGATSALMLTAGDGAVETAASGVAPPDVEDEWPPDDISGRGEK
jgi:hypothetical protein